MVGDNSNNSGKFPICKFLIFKKEEKGRLNKKPNSRQYKSYQ
jgi:hypothetical protein